MSQFYSRYVPSAATKDVSSPQASDLKRPSTLKSPQPTKKRKLEDQNGGYGILAKYSSTESAKKHAGGEKVAIRKKKDVGSVKPVGKVKVKSISQEERGSNSATKDTANGEFDQDVQAASSDEPQTKHIGVLSRMQKSKDQAQRTARGDVKEAGERNEGSTTEHTIHPDRAVKMDLGPIPQPQDSEPIAKPLLYSTVPEWVQNSIRVDEGVEKTFEELGILDEVLKNLRTQGKNKALPVQSTVLPLLLNKELERRHDICIAAATGSGKTFAYVLPVLQSLLKRKIRALRAVIVVPTRALVKQVLHTLETCSAGLDVQLGSVEGSKSLEEERKQLVEEHLFYDPEEYRRQQESPVDWSKFSLEETIEQAYNRDLLGSVGHIYEYVSKVDILVATPGRLIEHLQSTKGFNLDYVEWFIADEADRLLNESYHDWLDVVLPALKSQKATANRDMLLEQMRMEIPTRRVTKILLSATMTNDVQQLMSIELHNPKLVLMENTNAERDHDIRDTYTIDPTADFTLPSRLQESAIAFKDSDNKPLYLLELLNQQILNNPSSLQKPASTSTLRTQTSLTNGVRRDTSSSSSSDSSSDSESDSSDPRSSQEMDESSDSDSDTSTDTTSNSSLSSSSSSVTNKRPPTTHSRNKIQSNHPSIAPYSQSTLPRALIFTKSTESAHRLARLLCLISPSLEPVTATLTRSSSSSSNTLSTSTVKATKHQQRTFRKTLTSFIAGTTRILISTDLSSRGLDIPNLEHVVNYDIPASALTYVHRVGRTARAGQAGCAWTLVEHKQGKWFWETIAGKSGGNGKFQEGDGEGGAAKQRSAIARSRKVAKVEVKIGEEWIDKYEDALKRLEEDVTTTRR